MTGYIVCACTYAELLVGYTLRDNLYCTDDDRTRQEWLGPCAYWASDIVLKKGCGTCINFIIDELGVLQAEILLNSPKFICIHLDDVVLLFCAGSILFCCGILTPVTFGYLVPPASLTSAPYPEWAHYHW